MYWNSPNIEGTSGANVDIATVLTNVVSVFTDYGKRFDRVEGKGKTTLVLLGSGVLEKN